MTLTNKELDAMISSIQIIKNEFKLKELNQRRLDRHIKFLETMVNKLNKNNDH